jgi:hypothetical protein
MNQQKPSNPYLTMAVNFITNPYVLAGLGGAAGYYFFGRKDGKTMEGKRPYVAAGIGAVGGLAAGKLIQHMRMQQQAQISTQQQQAQIQAAQQEVAAQAQGMADYYNMETVEGGVPDVDEAFGQQAPPQAQHEQGVPLQADLEAPVDGLGLGSLEGTNLGSNGLGSLGRDDGFDAYDEGVDEAIADATKNRNMN